MFFVLSKKSTEKFVILSFLFKMVIQLFLIVLAFYVWSLPFLGGRIALPVIFWGWLRTCWLFILHSDIVNCSCRGRFCSWLFSSCCFFLSWFLNRLRSWLCNWLKLFCEGILWPKIYSRKAHSSIICLQWLIKSLQEFKFYSHIVISYC